MGRPATTPACQREKEAASKRQRAPRIQRPPPPIADGTPLVLHTEALKGVLKGVTTRTSWPDEHGGLVFCVYVGVASTKSGKVMLEGGATRSVPLGAITQEAVANAEVVERCLPFVPYTAAAEEPARAAQSRARDFDPPAVVEAPFDKGPIIVYRVED